MKTKITIFVIMLMSMVKVGQATNTYNVATCFGTPITINATVPNGYWYLWSNGSSGPIQTLNPPANTTYTVHIMDVMFNPIDTSIYVVSVNPLPAVGIGGPAALCPGQSATLTATAGFPSYIWSTGAPTQAITVNQVGIYKVTVTDNNGCTNTAVRNLFQLQAPVQYTISSSSPYICNGVGVTIALGGSEINTGYQLLLNGVAVGGPASGTGGVIAFGGITTPGSYTVQATNGTGCQAMMLGTVNLSMMSPVSPAGPISGPISVCVNSGSYTYSIAPIPGATSYVWTATNGTINYGQGTTSVNVHWNGPNGLIAVYGVNACGNGVYNNQFVQVNPEPVVTITSNMPDHICLTQTAQLTASGADTYQWQIGPTTPSITVTPNATVTYIVFGFSQFGCMSQPASKTVFVETAPVVSVSTNSPVCEGDEVLFNTTVNQPSCTFNWTSPNGFWSNMQNPTIFSAFMQDAGTYQLTVTNQWTCKTVVQTTVTVNPTPTVSCSAISPVCAGGTINLLVAHTGNYVTWSGPNGFMSSLTNPVITNVNTTMTGWYKVKSYLGSCSAKDSVWVQVNPKPNILISANPPTVCEGQPTTLTASGATNYTWFNSLTGSSIVVNPTSTANTYSVTGTNQYGCQGIANITVPINGSTIQSIFTSAGMVTCPGGSDGWANVSPLNGNYPYTYSWNPTPQTGQGNNAVSGLYAGIWKVTITDAHGCFGSNTVTITEPDPIIITPIVNGQSVTVMVTGGTLLPGNQYQYNWLPTPINGQGTATATFAAGINTVTLTVTDGHYCTQNQVIYLNSSGFEDIEKTNIKIYPNPTNDIVHIETGEIEVTEIQLFDITGRIVYTGQEKNINLTSFSAGLYTLRLTTDDGKMFRSKVIKE